MKPRRIKHMRSHSESAINFYNRDPLNGGNGNGNENGSRKFINSAPMNIMTSPHQNKMLGNPPILPPGTYSLQQIRKFLNDTIVDQQRLHQEFIRRNSELEKKQKYLVALLINNSQNHATQKYKQLQNYQNLLQQQESQRDIFMRNMVSMVNIQGREAGSPTHTPPKLNVDMPLHQQILNQQFYQNLSQHNSPNRIRPPNMGNKRNRVPPPVNSGRPRPHPNQNNFPESRPLHNKRYNSNTFPVRRGNNFGCRGRSSGSFNKDKNININHVTSNNRNPPKQPNVVSGPNRNNIPNPNRSKITPNFNSMSLNLPLGDVSPIITPPSGNGSTTDDVFGNALDEMGILEESPTKIKDRTFSPDPVGFGDEDMSSYFTSEDDLALADVDLPDLTRDRTTPINFEMTVEEFGNDEVGEEDSFSGQDWGLSPPTPSKLRRIKESHHRRTQSFNENFLSQHY